MSADIVAELREMVAALARVRALHQPVISHPYTDTAKRHCDSCGGDYPCSTIRALEGPA